MVAKASPVETRAQDEALVAACSLEGLRDKLPLRWPAPPNTPPSPKKRYRSHYTYLGWEDLQEATFLTHSTDFDLLLRLVDFSPLRPVLAHLLGWTSARGQVPFDPISLFLFLGWQITQGWNRSRALRALRHPRYADYARLFGFSGQNYPTEGGIRHFLTALGQDPSPQEQLSVQNEDIVLHRLNQLLAQSISLIRQAGVLSPQAWQQALLCPDGMLHQAASRRRCHHVTDTCYRPTSPQAPRPCPAKEKGRRGCDCDSFQCAQICRQAPARDPQARYVYYRGHNRPESPNAPAAPDPQKSPKGKGVYGYRSLPLQLIDASRRFSLVLANHVQPANLPEVEPVAALLGQLPQIYPTFQVQAVAGDAGFGQEPVLRTIYQDLHARRVIDLRAHTTDRDQSRWPLRGYDDRGRPVCPFGYALSANGFDDARQRHKWICRQACRQGKKPLVTLSNTRYPPIECPYAAPHRPHGLIVNIGLCFSDGSLRLVRDLPVGTPTWKRYYHRARNAVEGRNAAFEAWNLKRSPVYGLPRTTATIFQADLWLNLTTMARLIREATLANRVT